MPRDLENGRRLRREHYYRNKEYYIKKSYERTLLVKLEIEKWIASYVESHHCVDCGESDILVLDFDHRDGVEKLFEIGNGRRLSKTIKAISAEVEKCDVRCANCHKRRTAYQFNFWRIRYVKDPKLSPQDPGRAVAQP